MKEIILLNFGNFSNYISTHFWNLNVITILYLLLIKLYSIINNKNKG